MPKKVLPLTDLKLRSAKPQEKPCKLTDGGGLYLLIKPDGGRYWRMDYRHSGLRRTLAFGVYPQVSLADARDKRLAAQRLLNAGTDPGEQKKTNARLKTEAGAHTFERIAREWHQNRLSTWTPRTAADILNRFEKDIFPEIGAIPIGNVTHQDMIAALRKIEARGVAEIANRAKANCARVFAYANQLGIHNLNPAANMKDVLKPVKAGHFASIGKKELPDFLGAMHKNQARLFVPTRIALNLMLLLFVRTSELLETPWSEIDLDSGEWIIPWQRMKQGKKAINPDTTDHYVPLPRQAVELLRELHTYTGRNKWLFPNQRDHEKPMSNGAILAALKRMGYQNRMTGHGFRSLAMSVIKEDLDYRHEVIDRQLAHAHADKVRAAYDRADFRDQRKKMMQDYADYLDVIASGKVIVGAFSRAA